MALEADAAFRLAPVNLFTPGLSRCTRNRGALRQKDSPAPTKYGGKLAPMKPLLQSRTPMQLVWLGVASNALIVLCAGVFFVVSSRLPQGARIPFQQKLPWLALIAFGLVGSVLAETSLRKGIATNRWSNTLLVAPGNLVARPVFSVLCWSLIVAPFALVIFSRGQHFGGTVFLLAPQMGLTRLRLLLQPPADAAANSGLSHPAKPLQSEHWGTPPQSSSN